MNTNDNVNFSATIPAQSGILQYYFKAVDTDTYAFNPIGGALNPYEVDLEGGLIEDSFEDGMVLWKTGGTNDRWGLTTSQARTGNLSISDSPTINYLDNTDSWLESKFKLNLFNHYGAEVSFYYRGVIQSGVDFLYFEYSTDGGSTWQQFPNPISGSFFNFTQYSASLADLGGQPDVRLRFHLVTNSSGRREGIYIDDFTINLGATGVEDGVSVIPLEFELLQNYPNPFNARTRISFVLDKGSYTDLAVYDLLGRQVTTLVSGELPAGKHEVLWDGVDQGGNAVASGIYLYRLKSESNSQVRRMSLLK
jgi:hypothetical protein